MAQVPHNLQRGKFNGRRQVVNAVALSFTLLLYTIAALEAHAQVHDSAGVGALVLQEFFEDASKQGGREISDRERLQWRRDWLARLMPAYSQEQDVATKRAIAAASLGLANAVSDFDAAEELLQFLASASEDAAEKTERLAELGGLYERKIKSAGATGRERELSTQTFEKAIESLEKQGAALSDPSAHARLIRTLVDLGRVSMGSATTHGAAKAIQYYGRARVQLQKLTEAAVGNNSATAEPVDHHVREASSAAEVLRELAASQITRENLAGSELLACAIIPKDDHALKVLGELADMSDRKHPIRFYVMLYAKKAYREHTKGFQAILERWLGTVDLSYDSLLVTNELGTSYLTMNNFARAAELMKPAYSDRAVAIYSENEPGTFSAKRGGGLSDALYIATRSEWTISEFDNARNAAKLFLSFFENDDRADYMRGILTANPNAIANVSSSPTSRSILIVLNVFVVLFIIALLLRRQFRRGRAVV
jgi:hypothetical protein